MAQIIMEQQLSLLSLLFIVMLYAEPVKKERISYNIG